MPRSRSTNSAAMAERAVASRWRNIQKLIELGEEEIDRRVDVWAQREKESLIRRGLPEDHAEADIDLARRRHKKLHYNPEMIMVAEEAIRKYGLDIIPDEYRTGCSRRTDGSGEASGGDEDGGEGGNEVTKKMAVAETDLEKEMGGEKDGLARGKESAAEGEEDKVQG